MKRAIKLGAMVALFFSSIRIAAQYQFIELADIQLAKSVGATIQDPTGAPIPKASVREFSADWRTVLRSTSTDTKGRFSFTPAQGMKVYFIQISAPGLTRCASAFRWTPSAEPASN